MLSVLVYLLFGRLLQAHCQTASAAAKLAVVTALHVWLIKMRTDMIKQLRAPDHLHRVSSLEFLCERFSQILCLHPDGQSGPSPFRQPSWRSGVQACADAVVSDHAGR